jgi:hypothetical protein
VQRTGESPTGRRLLLLCATLPFLACNLKFRACMTPSQRRMGPKWEANHQRHHLERACGRQRGARDGAGRGERDRGSGASSYAPPYRLYGVF